MDKSLMNYDVSSIETPSINLNVYDYTSLNLEEVKEYLNSLDKTWFDYLKINTESKIERVVYDYYSTSDYYDLILFINGRLMLEDMPYSYDILIETSEDSVNDYILKSNIQISDQAKIRLTQNIEDKLSKKNNKLLFLKIIKSQFINTVVKNIKDITERQKEMLSIVNGE